MDSFSLQALSVQQIEAPMDPKTELSRLISEHKYEEAFTVALQRSDVSIVSWLCMQVCFAITLTLTQNLSIDMDYHFVCLFVCLIHISHTVLRSPRYFICFFVFLASLKLLESLLLILVSFLLHA